MAFFIGSLGIEDTRRNCLVLIGLPEPIYTSDFFLCSISHLNEHFRWSHSLYLKLQFVFPSARWRTLTAAAASYQSHINSPHLLSPVFGPCFRLYGSLLFSEGSDLSLPSFPLTYDLKFLFPSFLSDSKGPFLPGLWGGWVAVENWLVSFTSSGGGPPVSLFFFFFFFQFLSEGLKSAGLSWMRYQSPRFPDATLRPWHGVDLTKTLVHPCPSECFLLRLQLAKTNLYLQTTLIVPALFLVLVFPFPHPPPPT